MLEELRTELNAGLSFSLFWETRWPSMSTVRFAIARPESVVRNGLDCAEDGRR